MVGATSTRKKQYACIDFDLFQYHKTVSTVALSPLFSLPSGQGLEMCGPHRRIQQAVCTVATLADMNSFKAPYHPVSIP